jgi:hypothetical protein
LAVEEIKVVTYSAVMTVAEALVSDAVGMVVAVVGLVADPAVAIKTMATERTVSHEEKRRRLIHPVLEVQYEQFVR